MPKAMLNILLFEPNCKKSSISYGWSKLTIPRMRPIV